MYIKDKSAIRRLEEQFTLGLQGAGRGRFVCSYTDFEEPGIDDEEKAYRAGQAYGQARLNLTHGYPLPNGTKKTSGLRELLAKDIILDCKKVNNIFKIIQELGFNPKLGDLDFIQAEIKRKWYSVIVKGEFDKIKAELETRKRR
jgi:hypothetical protein